MFKRFVGVKYQFEAHYRPYKHEFDFRLLAMHQRSRRHSTINTLNRILSWFEIEEGDPRFQESIWLVSKSELERLLQAVEEILDDPESRAYLEAALDEDRSASEWENKRRKRTTKKAFAEKRR